MPFGETFKHGLLAITQFGCHGGQRVEDAVLQLRVENAQRINELLGNFRHPTKYRTNGGPHEHRDTADSVGACRRSVYDEARSVPVWVCGSAAGGSGTSGTTSSTRVWIREITG